MSSLSFFVFHDLDTLQEYESGILQNASQSGFVWCFLDYTGIMNVWKEYPSVLLLASYQRVPDSTVFETLMVLIWSDG